MGRFTETLHGGQGSSHCLDIVSGYTLKMIRESVGLTQTELARDHEVDVATVQGWESGRRPLTALRVRDLARLRARLSRLSASPRAIRVLDDAIDADLIISDAVEAGHSLVPENEHLLGATAHQRTLQL
jgi:transcriptional regulator with XRE-family HTH domain